MNVRPVPPSPRGERGFSLLELLVVVAVIAIMAAVAIPNIARYIRNYQIRGAAQQVAGEIQTARAKAINKNVNFGVVFVTLNNQSYQYTIEDDIGPRTGIRQTVATQLANPAQSGPVRVLPNGITFAAGCPGFAANDSGFRFNRLGSTCDPGSDPAACPALGAGQNLLMTPDGTGGTTICLAQPLTSLTRRITVTPGGRVMVQQ
jgi:prepilin-type N-terminal cleavage/methylation domain-containing protein